jgi:hypothetical protein
MCRWWEEPLVEREIEIQSEGARGAGALAAAARQEVSEAKRGAAIATITPHFAVPLALAVLSPPSP